MFFSLKNAITDESKNFIRSSIGMFVYKNKYRHLYTEIKKNEKYRDMYKGRRCFVLGCGPSMKNQDLKVLKDEIVFSVNRFFWWEEAKIIKPKYHFFADPKFFDETYTEENLKIFEEIKELGGDIEVFFVSKAYDYLKKYKVDEMLNVNFFAATQSFNAKKLEYDYTKFITGFWTVVQFAVTMAIYMGFEEIYLLGCDNTGIVEFCNLRQNILNAGQGHIYEERDKAGNILKAQQVSCIDMFQGWANMFKGYEALHRFCKKKGIKLYNATKGGVMDNIPRVEFESLFY